MPAPPAFYRSTVPPEPLRHVIHSFWIYDGYAPSHVLERVLPTANVELLFPLGGQRLRWRDLSGTQGEVLGPAVSGPRVSAYDVPTETQRRMIGAHLFPGGAWSLLGVPVDQLAEPHRPLEDLLGASIRELTESLEDARGHQEQFSLLSAYFLEQYRRCGARAHPVVARAVRQIGAQRDPGDSPSIAEIVASSGLSHRRFVEVFRREIGLTPRDFRRVRRFHETLEHLGEGGWNGARIAVEAGFFDQSHSVLECKKMSGWAPRALFDARRAAEVLPGDVRGQMLPIP